MTGSPAARRSSARPGSATACSHFGDCLQTMAAVTCLTTSASEIVVCTCGNCCSCHARRSACCSVAYCEAALRRRLDDHREHVGRQREVRRDERVVDVVARVGPQFRRARVEVADLQLLRDEEARRCRAPPPRAMARPRPALLLGEVVEQRPDAASLPAPCSSSLTLRVAAFGLTPVNDSSTGSSTRLVKSSTHTPIVAAIASSRIAGNRDQQQHRRKPAAPFSSAVTPATKSRRNV